jgi:hypothetical protein
MNEQSEGVKAALEAVASHPKVASGVAAATTAMGAASLLSQIQTVLGLISLAIGCVVGVYVLRINHIKHKIYERMYEKGESLKE